MKLNRRQFFMTATGALAYASAGSVLKTPRVQPVNSLVVGFVPV